MKKFVAKYLLIISAIALVILAIGLCFDRFVLKLSLAKQLGRYYPLAIIHKLDYEKCEFNPRYNPAITTLPHRNFIAHAGGAILKNAQGEPQTYTYKTPKKPCSKAYKRGFRLSS